MSTPRRDSLHVAHIGFFNDPGERKPAQLLEAWPTLVDTAEAAASSGVRVSVVQACAHVGQLEKGDVRYYFLPFGAAHRQAPLGPLGEVLRTLAPTVLHVHGLNFPRQVQALAALFPDIPIVLQDHASRPPRIWRRPQWRRALSAAAGVAFCAADQAAPFAAAGLLRAQTRVYGVPESTSRFAPGDRAAARRETFIRGDPAILWVGHLDSNKDPLSILDGISTAVRALPQLQLWCCFGTAPLLRPVAERIARDARLRGRVWLLGRVPHRSIEQLMRAADIFVLGSHREGSGYSLIEALACGLPPVVTDIPSFRALTGQATVGRLWPCGDGRALAAGLQDVAALCGEGSRAAVRAHFERELSFGALGRKLAAMYQDVLAVSPNRSRRDALLQPSAAAMR